MPSVTLLENGVYYNLSVNTDAEGFTSIAIESDRPPLGLSSQLWSFYGSLPTPQQEAHAVKVQMIGLANVDGPSFKRHA